MTAAKNVYLVLRTERGTFAGGRKERRAAGKVGLPSWPGTGLHVTPLHTFLMRALPALSYLARQSLAIGHLLPSTAAAVPRSSHKDTRIPAGGGGRTACMGTLGAHVRSQLMLGCNRYCGVCTPRAGTTPLSPWFQQCLFCRVEAKNISVSCRKHVAHVSNSALVD